MNDIKNFKFCGVLLASFSLIAGYPTFLFAAHTVDPTGSGGETRDPARNVGRIEPQALPVDLVLPQAVVGNETDLVSPIAQIPTGTESLERVPTAHQVEPGQIVDEQAAESELGRASGHPGAVGSSQAALREQRHAMLADGLGIGTTPEAGKNAATVEGGWQKWLGWRKLQSGIEGVDPWGHALSGGAALPSLERAPKSESVLSRSVAAPVPAAAQPSRVERILHRGLFLGVPWDVLSLKLARWPTWAVFAGLSVPQIYTFAGYLFSGHPEYLAGIPFIGSLSNILADAMLMMFFGAQSEIAPAVVQTTGVVMMSVVLSQLAWAGYMPGSLYALAMPIILTHLFINIKRFRNKTRERFMFGLISWNGWQKFISMLGLYMLIPGIATVFGLHHHPAMMGLALAMGLVPAGMGLYALLRERLGKPAPKGWPAWDKLGGYLATAFFFTLPVAVLMNNYLIQPEEMRGIAPLTQFLAMFGNLLMLGRAMITKNAVWFVGSGWAVAGGIAVLTDLYWHGLFSLGQPLIPIWFWAFSGSLGLLGFAYIVFRNTRHFGYSSVWQSFDFLRRNKETK